MENSFLDLCAIIEKCYENTLGIGDGEVANYIPQLAKVNPDLYGEMEGTGAGAGGAGAGGAGGGTPFHAKSKYIVHDHVGYEPSGRAFNEFVLNPKGLPHNPLINAGAIMVSSLIKPESEPSHRFESIQKFYKEMGGNRPGIGFDNAVFLSEKRHADRNISLAYFMREKKAYVGYPTASEIDEHLDLYFQSCSITSNCETAAVIAATLANSGVCPITNQQVVAPLVTKDALSIMYTCGMYDFSGQFSFEIGLPAKSGVSGCVLLCIPNVGGFCIWSPRLDAVGNSVRGVHFCQEFTRLTNSDYHMFHRVGQKLRKSHSAMFEIHGARATATATGAVATGTDSAAPTAAAAISAASATATSTSAAASASAAAAESSSFVINEDVHVSRLLYSAGHAPVGDFMELVQRSARALQRPNEALDAACVRVAGMCNYDQRTPLHLAAAEGNIDVVYYIVGSLGCGPNPKDRWGNTPAFEATRKHGLGLGQGQGHGHGLGLDLESLGPEQLAGAGAGAGAGAEGVYKRIASYLESKTSAAAAVAVAAAVAAATGAAAAAGGGPSSAVHLPSASSGAVAVAGAGAGSRGLAMNMVSPLVSQVLAHTDEGTTSAAATSEVVDRAPCDVTPVKA